MYFVNLTATREQNGTERFEVMWGVGDKVRERTEDVSSFLDAADVAQHYLNKLFEFGCSAVRSELNQFNAGAFDFCDRYIVGNPINQH